MDTPGGSVLAVLLPWLELCIFFLYREVYRVTETLQREKSGLLKQLDFLR